LKPRSSSIADSRKEREQFSKPFLLKWKTSKIMQILKVWPFPNKCHLPFALAFSSHNLYSQVLFFVAFQNPKNHTWKLKKIIFENQNNLEELDDKFKSFCKKSQFFASNGSIWSCISRGPWKINWSKIGRNLVAVTMRLKNRIIWSC
jgi:hypothetical protein